ncbi:EAL domain-containing protein [Noviherbaspirillum sp. 17J57-3]|uniref:EAL domain-containing protein n=2 Tax=Noviherbaspirillum galbum TaxID=2709383 RepID=A0A6B3SSL6_9BURK|nr:EAL domain-containing protein [Noviherbaspirillum galbum]
MWVRVACEPVSRPEGHVIEGVIKDLSVVRAAQGEVRRLSNRLSTTLEELTDAFFSLDKQWHFTFVNHETERVLQRPRDEIIGKEIWEAFPKLRGTAFEAGYRQAVESQRKVTFEAYYPPRHAWFETTVYPSEEGLTVYCRDVSERKIAEEEVQRLAFYDPLTGLANRRLLIDRLKHSLARLRRQQRCAALLLIDLDNFKLLNDTAGHDRGDALLREVATRLRQSVRSSDTVARIGGDEFVVLVELQTRSGEVSARRAASVADKVLRAMCVPFPLTDLLHHASASVGVTLLDGTINDVGEALRQADLAMYQSKSRGRNAVSFYDPGMQAAVAERVALQGDMLRGIEVGQFHLHYQPQVDEHGNVTGAEALLRWQHPQRGWISPATFIPIAEESGHIISLGNWVLETACRQVADWRRMPGRERMTMAVNVSAVQLRRPDFVQTVMQTLCATEAPPDSLRLELTESLLLHDIDDTIAKMEALRAHGVGFEIDDFGTGYSSLSYLKRLPINVLKIDRTFVRDLLENDRDAAIVHTIITLADSLGIGVIAEGVETKEQYDDLQRLGCRAFQGYLFGYPVPAGEFCTRKDLEAACGAVPAA